MCMFVCLDVLHEHPSYTYEYLNFSISNFHVVKSELFWMQKEPRNSFVWFYSHRNVIVPMKPLHTFAKSLPSPEVGLCSLTKPNTSMDYLVMFIWRFERVLYWSSAVTYQTDPHTTSKPHQEIPQGMKICFLTCEINASFACRY